MEGESGVTRSIMEELHSPDIQGIQREGESGVTRNINGELHSGDIQGDEMEGESIVLLEVSLTNFILRLLNEIK